MRLLAPALVVLSLLVVGGAARADDVADRFDRLFGADVKRVSATSSKADDAKLAGDILESVDKLKDDHPLAALACEKAYELGLKDPAGFDTAFKAAQRLKEMQPERASECDALLLAVQQARYQKSKGSEKVAAARALVDQLMANGNERLKAGEIPAATKQYKEALTIATGGKLKMKDEIQRKIKSAESRQQVLDKATKIRQKIEAGNGDDVLRIQLAKMYIVDLDNPAGADPFTASDEKLHAHARLAATDMEKLTESEWLDVGNWYVSLAPDANEAGKVNVLERADAYLQRYLEAHTADDSDRLAANRTLNKVHQDLKAFAGSSSKVDLLALVDPSLHTVAGKWHLDGGKLACDAGGEQWIEFPFIPGEEYDFEVTFTVSPESTDVHVIGEAKQKNFDCVVIGGRAGDHMVGFDYPGVNFGLANTTRRPQDDPLKPGRHKVVIQVRKDGVQILLDGNTASVWNTTDFHEVQAKGRWIKHGGFMGVGTGHGPVIFSSVAVVEVTGKGRIVR